MVGTDMPECKRASKKKRKLLSKRILSLTYQKVGKVSIFLRVENQSCFGHAQWFRSRDIDDFVHAQWFRSRDIDDFVLLFWTCTVV